MVNKIWIGLVFISIFYSLITGNIGAINETIVESPKFAFDIFLEVFIMLVFWNGILEICLKSGFLSFIGKMIKRLIKPLFKNIDNDLFFDYLSGNIASNMLGLGSAATPMGLKAMEELQKENKSEVASKEMITLLILNTSGLTLIPETILSLRKMYDAKITVEVIPYVMLCSIVTSFLAIFLDYLFRRRIK